MRHEFRKIDLVGAAQNGHGIVDDGHSLKFRSAGETIGMVVYLGCVPDEQSVIFREMRKFILRDGLDAHVESGPCLDEIVQGFFIGGGQRIVGIDEHGQREGRRAQRMYRSGRAAAEVAYGFHKEGTMIVRHFGKRYGVNTAQLPFALFALDELCPQQGGRQHIEQAQTQLFITFGHIAAEINAQREGFALQRSKTFLDQFFQFGINIVGKKAAVQIPHGGDVGRGAMSARRGQQRDIVSVALVLIAAAEVENAAASVVKKARFGDVAAGRDNFDIGQAKIPLVRIGCDNDDFHHVFLEVIS